MEYFAKKNKEISNREIHNNTKVRELASECIVMLENDGVLPLKKKTNIALYGSGARRTIKGGSGSGNVNSRFIISIEEGLIDADFNIYGKSWLDKYDLLIEKAKKTTGMILIKLQKN